uniref:Uncharacterized protein n=1 Tax=Populus trichocarpa TaxID=3694 RepID=A0A2K1Z1E7_POPTR
MVSSLLNKNKIMPFLLVALSTSWMVQASDLDIVSDYVVPENSIPDADLFTFTGIRVFANGIDGVVLAKAFKTDVPTTHKIKAGLAAKA